MPIRDNTNFIRDVIPGDMLERAINWIRASLEPNEVFDADVLAEYVRCNFYPQKVFEEAALDEWARENGYAKASEKV